MECFEFGVTINNDTNDRLLNSVEYVAGFDLKKAKVLAGYVNSQEFLDFCKQSDKFDSNKSLAENNQNIVRSLLRKYWREHHKDILESAAKKQAEELQGFSSVRAKDEAIENTASVISRTYYDIKGKNANTGKKIDRIQVINRSIQIIEENFNKLCAIPLYKRLRPTKDSNPSSILDNFREANNNVNDIIRQIDKLKKDTTNNHTDEIKELTSKLIEARRLRFNAAHAMVAEYGSYVEKNHANYIKQMKGNPNYWFNKAFESSKLVSIVNEFKGILESDKLVNENFEDENDSTNPNAESRDEMSKSWEDKIWASFDKAVAADLKLYFNNLFKLSAKGTLGSEVYTYDTNNEVGVPMTMGANFVISQLINYGNYNSANDFIDSVINISQQVPECYGFIVIANRMIKDPVFANYLFTELANPKIIKTMAVLTEHGIDFSQSNKSADALSYVVYSMLNTTKSAMTSLYEESDYQLLLNLKNRVSRLDDELFKEEFDITNPNYGQLHLEDTIYNVLRKYYPQLNIVALKSYLTANPEQIKKRFIDLINDCNNLVAAVAHTITDQNKVKQEYFDAYNKWRKRREQADLAGTKFEEEPPVRDLSIVDYSRLNAPIIEIGKKIVNYSAVKNELNSVNAEGNLASDIIGNNWITNTLKQIAYSSKEDSEAGLKKLLNEVVKGEQYRYNSLFFGVVNSRGETISKGIFERTNTGAIKINKDARKIIQVSLFNGIKDSDNAKAVMYNRMSKGDYFLTNMYSFFNPVIMGEHIGTAANILKENYAGYFMRTPSDAPKNFIVQAPKLKTKGIFVPVASSVTEYLNKVRREISLLGFRDGAESKYQDIHDSYILNTSKLTKKQVWKAADIYDILKGNIDNLNYNNMYSIQNQDGSVTVPIVYKKDEDTDIIWIKGQKVLGETNHILYNIQVEDITGNNEEDMSDTFYADIADIVKQEGISNGQIETTINKSIPIFAGIRQNLLNEVNTFVDQLNNVFEKDNITGEWKLKKDMTGLIDRAHYNGGSIIKFNKDTNRYELSGNFFTFRKLFDTNSFKTQSSVVDGLFLYGGGNKALINLSENSGHINLNHDLIKEENGRLVLNTTKAINDTLDNITSNWLKEYSREIANRSVQYAKLLEERYTSDDVVECMLNYANASMSFDDVFEGDVKFYKNAQDFLKRAKEVQAAGKAYVGFDMNDDLSAPIKEVLDRNGAVQPIKIGDITIADFANAYSPVKGQHISNPAPANARNGFRAVTIYNTVRPSKYAKNIQKELFDILKTKMDESEATKIAYQVYKGYADNTKTNDAQSYITIEEFIRRRWADGTLDKYQDILQQIYDIRTGKKSVKDLDLAKINARIQVQKNFYFDKHFDTTTRTHYPRQIKNAEFVLIPELLEGTELKQLYDIMTKYDIGQINTAETSKAAKKNVLTFWDNDGNINPNFEADILANNSAAIEDYYYRFLYKQQEVPEHMRDETNKAGIQIMKKIVDNADESVEPYIKQFFDNYCANIKEDFNRMLYNMGWTQDENGNLVNIDGDKETLDFTDFYEKARHEAQRLGLDENFVDYITPDEFGNPAMPNYMNNVSSKLESIAQALFNSNITRQKLPGWHAAQVTQVGHGMKVLDASGKLRELKYHPENEDLLKDDNGNVITLYRGYSSDNENATIDINDTFLEKDKKHSLGRGVYLTGDKDTANAYANVHKGKAKHKYTHVNEYYIDTKGATIETFETFEDYLAAYPNNGEYSNADILIIKKSKTSTLEVRVKDINRIKTQKQEAYAEVLIPRWSNLIPKDYDISKLEKEGLDIQIAYRIPTEGKQSVSIVKVVGFLDDIYGSTIMLPDEWVTQTGADFDVDSVYAVCHELYKDKKTGEIRKWTAERTGSDVNKYRKYIAERINDKIPSELEDPLHENKFRKLKERLNEAVKNKDYKELNKIGVEAGLMSFNQFKNLPDIEKLPRAVRNNNILDAMIKIMESDNSREENYSRSNFDDITDAMKEMNTARGASSLTRSTYNLFDQIDFMENAMSGASLKAFSVTRDTFNSVNNRCKSYLGKGHEIIVEYDLTAKDKDGNNLYSFDTIVNAYGLYSEDNKEGNVLALDKDNKLTTDKTKVVKLRVKHYQLANSKNNRNVVGKLLTVYSSETTAHILDAIKEGAIYNENEFTFGTFKTMIDIGIDYRTAIAFLMQPAITAINEVNSETNSIYMNGGANPTRTAIKRIAAKAGFTIKGKPIDDYTSYDDLMIAIGRDEKFQQAFKELFGAMIDDAHPVDNLTISLDATKLKRRLEQAEITNNPELLKEDKTVRDAAFDIAMVIRFEKMRDTTQNIEKIMRCSNPDRFGAKQTVRATRMIKDNITEYGFNENNPISKVIRVGDKNLLQALYPGFVKAKLDTGTVYGDIRVEDSAYPYLAAFFKYATLPSIQANSILFPTENEFYNNVTNAAQKKFGIIFNDEQYREYKQYMMSMIYASVPYINTPMTVTEAGWFDEDNDRIVDDTKNNTKYWNAEISRIFGFEGAENSNPKIKDIYNPTKEELAEFNKLTPAQKAIWVQYNFPDNKGIFDYINVNMFNQWEYKNKGYTHQNIKFTDASDKMSEVYLAFNSSFYNTCPLVRLATLDLIKYAFVVEGFKFKKGGLSKVITNNSMYKNIEDMGTAIIPMIRRIFNDYASPTEATTKTFMDKFIRSHSEYAKLLELGIPKNKNGNTNLAYKFNLYKQDNGLVFIPYENRAMDLLEAINAPQSSEDYDKSQEYIKIKRRIGKSSYINTLYKIHKNGKGVYLIPLNLLERNETGDYSVNPNNNKYPDSSYFINLINAANSVNVTTKELVKNEEGKYTDILPNRDGSIIPKFKFTTTKEALENPDEFRRTAIHGSNIQQGEINQLFKQINEYVNLPVEMKPSSALVWSNSAYIGSQIPKGAYIIQNIPVGDEIVPFEIKRVSQPKGFFESIKNRELIKDDELPAKDRIAYKYAYNARAQVSTYYEITPYVDKKVRDKLEKQDKEVKNKREPDLAAITTDASDFYVNENDKFDIVDATAIDLISAVRRAENNGDKNAERARRALDMKNINIGRAKDIVDNRKSIYSIVANYMEIYSNILDNTLNNYEIDGVKYNIGDDKLYDALREHPEEVETIVKLLLEAITFGQNLGSIMTLPFDSLDEETVKSIKRIRNSIIKIRNNDIVKRGFDKMFNNYIANEYATNPNVRLGLVNLNDTFGDAGWWESWIGDTAMISNKEIQTVVKIVNKIMTQAAIEDAPKRKQEFLDRLDKILNRDGNFDWNNIVDNQGRLIRPYTAQFIEDRNRLRDNVQQARDTYGEDSIEYIKAKLERDEWYAENVHQIVVPEYYKRKNALIRSIINNAPNEYVEYMKLIHELYNDNRPTGVLTKEERDRRKEINKKIAQLTSEYKDDYTIKSDEERYRAKQLKSFVDEKRKLDSEYFEWNEAYGFKEALENNLAIIDKYEKKHPDEPLDKRLQDDTYREAYEWVHDNSYYIIDKDTQKAISDAFKILKDEDNVKNERIKIILAKANAFDEFGNIDPRKLSDEDIAEIKNITKHKYDFSYDSNAGEAILIKDVPTGLPVLTDEFYRMLRDPSENADKSINPRRLKVIGKINELLNKVIGIDGRIHAKDIFEKLTEKEQEELAQLYHVLKSIKGKRKPKELREKFKKNVEFKTNTAAFNEELSWALTNIKGTKAFDTFIDIFVQTDSSGEIQLDEDGNYIPNNDIYGYIIPKDDKYINKDKTEARKLIEENVEFVPTEYYYAAMHKATEKGQFNDWFQKNHVYNPYKHKWEPLKVWTTMKVNPNGSLKGSYSYVPTYENQEKSVKEEYVNPEYKQYSNNYNLDTGEYNNYKHLTDKEKDVQELLEEAMDFFAKYNNDNSFIEQGFIPRKRKVETDSKWLGKQVLGSVGLEYRNDSEDKWYAKVDYANDRSIDNNMLHWLKGKGYQEYEKIRPRGINETPEEYDEYLKAVKERNAEIKAKNLEIDNALMDRDYRTVFAEAIHQQVINNAKSKAKNWLYLLQEELKSNEAYAISSLTGKVRIDKRRSTDAADRFYTTPQNRSLESVYAFTRRVIFDQFKKKTPLNKYADLARNITSAKYMIFNVTGGIANIGTGFVNIMGEAFAGDSFTKKDIKDAVGMYLNNSVSMLADMYKDKSDNLAVALTKYFNVVDFDAISERVAGETAGEYARRMRNLLYSLQSGGEHFMQNSVLFAVLKGSRIFNDIDGTKRAGTFQEYIWKTEYDTLLSVIGNDESLMDNFKEMKRQIKTDKQETYKYDTFRRNIVEDFLRAHCSKEQIEQYITKRKDAINTAKEKWDSMPIAIEQFEIGSDGELHIKDGSELTLDMVFDLKNKTIALNKKIHGVYDKIGAARIEFSWWGGLVMQYHKHLYPGIMKRFRWKGYYNEQTNTVEMGSYAAFIRLLGREFRGISDRINNRAASGQEKVIASIIETGKTALDTVLNIKVNWNLMPQWERNAVKRCLGDLYGVVSAMIMATAIYAMTDDDDEKESELIATALYISDRLLSEAQQYTPWGMISESKTLWSSPIAAANGPEDLLKGLGFLAQWLFDEDFDPTYQTGLYAGENKGWVLLKRNIPLYRVIDRLSNMTKNNSYYRINEKALNMRITKNIADYINPD